MCQIDLYKFCQIAAIVQIDLASMIFTNSNICLCQIAAIVHFGDLVAKSIWQRFGSSICSKIAHLYLERSITTTTHNNTHTHTPPPPSPPLPAAAVSVKMSANEAYDDNISKDKPSHMPDITALARDIQNWVSRCVGTATTEARYFREFFGTSLLVVEKTWELLERDSLLPEGGHPKHLLWTLHFMKVYTKQSPGCSAAGASAGAVNPKTHRKWVWALIDAIANLVNTVVSFRH